MIYVLYDDDADGFSACFAAYLKFGTSATYVAVNRGDLPPEMPEASEIYILDFNYPRAVMEQLAQMCSVLVLIDHHISAQIELQGLPYCHFNVEKSAAVLSWEYFHPDRSVPVFFHFVQDADLWQWKIPFSREIHYAIESYDQNFDTWDQISGLSNDSNPDSEFRHLNELIEQGKPILRFVNQQIDRVSSKRQAVFVTGSTPYISFDPEEATEGADRFVVPVVNSTLLQSEIGNKLLDENPTARFVAFYKDLADGRRQWGLRSRDADVSLIARQFGGGGHQHAAGFTTFHDASYGVPVKTNPVAAMSSEERQPLTIQIDNR